MPLTHLAAPDGIPDRPALAVKIDNAPPARPQTGVNAADIVFDTLVEGGLSRLFAVFHTTTPAVIGPVRSARPVDADLLPMFGHPVFGYSGAALGEIAPVKDHGQATLVADDDHPRPFTRDTRRKAPYNLYASAASLLDQGHRLGNPGQPPPPVLTYGPVAGGVPAAAVDTTIGIRSHNTWRWNTQTSLWERDQEGQPDLTTDAGIITATNVIYLSTATRGTGIFDAAHEEDPLVVVIGTGPCWVARNGTLATGTWSRQHPTDPITLTASDGTPLTVSPGRTWVELVPAPNTPTPRNA